MIADDARSREMCFATVSELQSFFAYLSEGSLRQKRVVGMKKFPVVHFSAVWLVVIDGWGS